MKPKQLAEPMRTRRTGSSDAPLDSRRTDHLRMPPGPRVRKRSHNQRCGSPHLVRPKPGDCRFSVRRSQNDDPMASWGWSGVE